MSDAQAPVRDPRPMRRCYKCGREIGPDESICAVCNRAGMATPSATQYHGTIVVAIIAGVVLLAVLASMALRGVGPYTGNAIDVRAGGQGVVVATLRVTNEGSKAGRAKCEVTARDAAGHPIGAATAVSPEIPGGGSVTFDQSIAGVDTAASVSVSCQ
jgi:hypothetical protein